MFAPAASWASNARCFFCSYAIFSFVFAISLRNFSTVAMFRLLSIQNFFIAILHLRRI